MEYKEIKLKVAKDGIQAYKVFSGAKIFSRGQKSEDGTHILSQRIYQTPKGNFVYYQRNDVNWSFWSDKARRDAAFIPCETGGDAVFEVFPDLDGAAKYIAPATLEALKEKIKGNTLVEHLDI